MSKLITQISMIQLTDFLGSKICLQIIDLFIQKPETEMYQAEVINEIKLTSNPKLSFPSAKKWLDFLVQNGLLFERIKGKWVLYSLDRENPVVKQYKIFTTTAKLYELIRAQFVVRQSEKVEIFLFGSTARGEDGETSDVDLLLVGSLDTDTLANLKSALMEKMQREVTVVAYTRTQYSELYRTNKPFYENLDRDKIRLW